MKYSYAAVLVAVVVTTLSLAAVAYGQVVSNAAGAYRIASPRYNFKSYANERPTLFLLKSNSEVIGELRALAGTASELTSGRAEFNKATRGVTATDGAALEITDGTKSVSARADEIQFGPMEMGDKQASGERVFLLKSGGVTIAELRVRAPEAVSIESANSSGHSEYNAGTGTVVAKGGVILKVTAGTSSTSLRAEEIESVSGSK
jgi:hypothetical protein